MSETPRETWTSTTLLAGLRDTGNREVWESFVRRYRPLVLAAVRRHGVPAQDAEDVAQSSLETFCRAYAAGEYDRGRGRLRAWLFGIVHGQVRTWRRRAHAAPRAGATEIDARLAGIESDEAGLEAIWEDEWRQAVLRECLAQVAREVEPATLRAFEATALEGRAVEDVARELELTANAVYGARRRVLARVRELLPLMDEVF